MQKLILAAFKDKQHANQAIDELENMGALREDFSLVMEEPSEEEGFGETLTKNATIRTASEVASVGGAIGGLAGLIAGAAATAGMFMAGPLVILAGFGWVALTTVAGSAIGAATGGVVGALVGIGVPQHVAKHHDSVIREGGVLLGLQNTNVDSSTIRSVFEEYQGEHITEVEHHELPVKMSGRTLTA